MRSGGAVNSRSQIPFDRRPDLIDLAGPDYDVDIAARGTKTLIVCSAPRTGSYELCRFLLAAGLGIPFEYMHPQFANQIGPRWGLPAEPLRGENISSISKRFASAACKTAFSPSTCNIGTSPDS
jgi:hypothetical protein